jgi:hemerythrin superfamily protein
MDALALLTADHNWVRGLFERFQAAQEADDTAAMAQLASTIVTELTVHTSIEEEIFYPATHDLSEDVGETVDEGVEEHHLVKILIDEITGLEPGDDAWVAKLSVLIENVEHHAGEEETELFPEVRSQLAAEDLERLGQRLDARKGELGAPTLADTVDLTNDQLHHLATEQAIPGRSSMAHDELAATVSPGSTN